MKMIYIIFSMFVSVMLIALMFTIFQNMNDISVSNTITGMNVIELYQYNTNETIIFTERNLTIDCDYMDLDNMIIYYNGLTFNEFIMTYNEYIKMSYDYNCDDYLLNIRVWSIRDILIAVDLKINNTLMEEQIQ